MLSTCFTAMEPLGLVSKNVLVVQIVVITSSYIITPFTNANLQKKNIMEGDLSSLSSQWLDFPLAQDRNHRLPKQPK